MSAHLIEIISLLPVVTIVFKTQEYKCIRDCQLHISLLTLHPEVTDISNTAAM
jgi:hypothetical protein